MPSILIYSKLNNQSSCSITRQLPLPAPENRISAVLICTCTHSECKIAKASHRISALCVFWGGTCTCTCAHTHTQCVHSFFAGIWTSDKVSLLETKHMSIRAWYMSTCIQIRRRNEGYLCQIQPLFILSIQTFVPSFSCLITYRFFFLAQYMLMLPPDIHGKSHLCRIVLFSQFVWSLHTLSILTALMPAARRGENMKYIQAKIYYPQE